MPNCPRCGETVFEDTLKCKKCDYTLQFACYHCGKAVPKGERLCPTCKEAVANRQAEKKTNVFMVILCVVAAAILAVFLFVFFTGR